MILLPIHDLWLLSSSRVLEIGCQGQTLTEKLQEQVGGSGGILVGMDIESRKPPKLLEVQPPNPRKAMYRTSAGLVDRRLVLVDDVSSIHDHLRLGKQAKLCQPCQVMLLSRPNVLKTINMTLCARRGV